MNPVPESLRKLLSHLSVVRNSLTTFIVGGALVLGMLAQFAPGFMGSDQLFAIIAILLGIFGMVTAIFLHYINVSLTQDELFKNELNELIEKHRVKHKKADA